MINIKNHPVWMLIKDNELDFIINKLPSQNIKNLNIFIEELFSLIGEEYETNKRNIIVAILLINKFPNELLSSNRGEEEDNLYHKAKEIYELLGISNIDYIILAKKIYTFSIMYSEWKTKDKEMQLNILAELYYRYSEDIREFLSISTDSSKKIVYNKIFKEFLNKVLNQMLILDKNWKEYLTNYNYKKIDFDENSQKFMYNKLTEVYWEHLKLQQLSRYPCDIIKQVITDYIILFTKIDNSKDLNYLYNHKSNLSELYQELVNLNKLLGDSFDYRNIIKKEDTFKFFKIIFNYLEKVLLNK